MAFRMIGRKLGLTWDTRTELSDVLFEETIVTDRRHLPNRDTLPLGVGIGNIAVGVAGCSREQFQISFKGPNISITRNDQGLYDLFEIGDTVKLGYREVYTVVVDYVPPNFDEKKEIRRKLVESRFVSANPIE